MGWRGDGGEVHVHGGGGVVGEEGGEVAGLEGGGVACGEVLNKSGEVVACASRYATIHEYPKSLKIHRTKVIDEHVRKRLVALSMDINKGKRRSRTQRFPKQTATSKTPTHTRIHTVRRIPDRIRPNLRNEVCSWIGPMYGLESPIDEYTYSIHVDTSDIGPLSSTEHAEYRKK